MFLDIPGGDSCENIVPFMCYYDHSQYPNQTARARELSEISGLKIIYSVPFKLEKNAPAKYAFKQAVKDGKIALSIEAGELGVVQDSNFNLIKQNICNMLADTGMYDSDLKRKNAKRTVEIFKNSSEIESSVKGIFYSLF